MKTQKESSDEKIRKPVNSYLKYSGIAFQMAGVLLAGIFGGRWLDEYFGNETPYITIFLLLFLFVGFLYKLYIDLGK